MQGAEQPAVSRPEGQQPQTRVSDQERDHAVELLSEHAAVGRLTLAELEERAERAYVAKTLAELEVLTRDLPARATPKTGRRKITRWFVAIMGGSDRRGRFRLSGTVNAVAIMGGDNIDLRDAEIDGDEVVINSYSVMGGSDIYVPDTVDVEVSGVAIMGGNDERGSRRDPRPGAPVIRIRAHALMGGITVWRLPAAGRGRPLKEARRIAKALERGDT